MLESLDYTAARFWFDVGQTVVMVAIGVYVWWVNREAALEKRIRDIKTALDDRCNRRETRISQLEHAGVDIRAELEHMPKNADIRDMTSKIAELNGRLSGINRAVDIINEFLIGQSGKGAS